MCVQSSAGGLWVVAYSTLICTDTSDVVVGGPWPSVGCEEPQILLQISVRYDMRFLKKKKKGSGHRTGGPQGWQECNKRRGPLFGASSQNGKGAVC